jgi:LysM repeat protein
MGIKQCKQFYYRVQEGDDFSNICNKFNTSKENIIRNNASLDLYIGEWILIKTNEFKMHYVKPAEKLIDIALKYDIDIEKLKHDNNLDNDKLYIGQMIKIY